MSNINLDLNEDKKILIADNDSGSRLVFKKYLSRKNFSVEEAEEAAKALEMLQSIKADLILIENDLPDMEGTDLIAKIRRSDKNRDASIILLSSKRSFLDRMNGLLSGANDYITKPFEMKELFNRIKLNLVEENRTAKRLELQPQYKQAAITLFSYLGTILQNKLKEFSVKLSLELEDKFLRMVITSEDCTESIIEDEMINYRDVIMGKISAEDYLTKLVDVYELKSQLFISQLQQRLHDNVLNKKGEDLIKKSVTINNFFELNLKSFDSILKSISEDN